MKMREVNFNFISDAGHGWLKVPIATVKALKVAVTSYSYKKGIYAYLEEDCDAGAFVKAFEAKTGIKLSGNNGITCSQPEDDSIIRTYERY